MNIAIICGDWLENEVTYEIIHRAFPQIAFKFFETFEQLLLGFDAVAKDINLIISETRVALVTPDGDFLERAAELERKFPDEVKNWECTNLPRELLKHLQSKGFQTPILFYTNDDNDWIDPEVRKDGRVTYLLKGTGIEPLVETVRELLRIPV